MMREPSEFYKVAARISTNRDFVKKFEELAVAVTSESIKPFYGNPRFSESEESLQLTTISNALLIRDPKKRSTAAEIATMCQKRFLATASLRATEVETLFQGFPQYAKV
jgi:hypothetical protein